MFWLALLGGLCCVLMLTTPGGAESDRTVAGWVENVRLYPGNYLIAAKLDTGADCCSLDASDLTEFRRDGKKWVRFNLVDQDGKIKTMEARLVRKVKIKRHNSTPDRRPVIRLGICLGNIFGETEVNLEDRRAYEYRMLIGRNFLARRVVVDPGAKYRLEPNCGEQPSVE